MAAGVVTASLLALNAVAYFHARAFLRFAAEGTKTRQPEDLSALEKAGVLFTGVTVPKPHDEATPAAFGMPFERHAIVMHERERSVKLGAWWIPHEQPRGAVILFHGFTASKAQLLPEAASFHARGFNVLMVDFRGSGDSSESYTTVGYDEAADVRAAVRYARDVLQQPPLVLYGHSMGAAAILRAVALGHDERDVSALVLSSVFDTMLNTVKQRFTSMGVYPTPFAELLVLWGGLQTGYWAFGHNPVEYARRCRLPTLVLHGSEDVRATPAQARSVFDALPEGHKTWLEFPGAGHESFVVRDRARWDAALDTLLGAR
jgi:hypothetical protein